MAEFSAEKRINILTYQKLHKKTADTLIALYISGYNNVCVYAMPLHYQKKYKPFIEHRPQMFLLDTQHRDDCEQITNRMGYQYRAITSYGEINEQADSVFLICGAGIIPKELYKKHRIINAHPGYLPMARGLDALKWAILEHQPIGVTTHLLGDAVDAGEIIERYRIPIYSNDTFHTVAYRQYQTEIQMLVRAVSLVDNVEFYTDGENYPIHRRMPHELEQKVFEAFAEQYQKHMIKEANICNSEI